MKYLDHTLPTPAENLACDEALLRSCDEAGGPEVLRVWEPSKPFVVLGYANKAAVEANLPACESRAVPVLRRVSGGGSVVQARGCLNYSLVLAVAGRERLASVTASTRFVLERHSAALGHLLGEGVALCGTSDLAWRGRKFSGNAQRRAKRAVLVHGTCLLGMDLALMDSLLHHPSREPDYRAGRTHGDFVCNIPVAVTALKNALRDAWNATEAQADLPREEIARLVRERYGRVGWSLRF
jgi:lipoate-protein ligase A